MVSGIELLDEFSHAAPVRSETVCDEIDQTVPCDAVSGVEHRCAGNGVVLLIQLALLEQFIHDGAEPFIEPVDFIVTTDAFKVEVVQFGIYADAVFKVLAFAVCPYVEAQWFSLLEEDGDVKHFFHGCVLL